jgi:hypothetical protein
LVGAWKVCCCCGCCLLEMLLESCVDCVFWVLEV